VLPRQAYAVALGKQAANRECLRGRPIEALAAREHLLLGVENALQGLVDRKTVGNGCQHLPQAPNLVLADCRGRVAATKNRLVGAAESRPAAAEPVGLVGKVGDGALELL